MSKLTAAGIKAAVKRGQAGVYWDGGGLHLIVRPSGAARWAVRVQFQGRRRNLGIGSLRDVPLAQAREIAIDIRRAARAGQDPGTVRQRPEPPANVCAGVSEDGVASDEAIAAGYDWPKTFENVARKYREIIAPTWRNAKHKQQWDSSLRRHIYPRFGDQHVNEITLDMVHEALADIWTAVPVAARRTRQRVESVLNFAHGMGWRDAEFPQQSLSKRLPRQPKRADNHFAALPWQEVPGFVASLPEIVRMDAIRAAVEMIILTASRPSEVRLARWSEINLKARVWVIPAYRMKKNRVHRVPLSDRVMEILEERRAVEPKGADCDLIFEGQRPYRPVSECGVRAVLGRAGLTGDATIHGFRSSFRDWAAETGVPYEVAEACLAHKVKDRTVASYARTDYMERRRTVMDDWATFVTNNNVIPFRTDYSSAAQKTA